MISPTDTAYRLLPTSPSARELMDAYTPGLFELKFAEERTVSASKAGDRNRGPLRIRITEYVRQVSTLTTKALR
jgi:hypothetical protein